MIKSLNDFNPHNFVLKVATIDINLSDIDEGNL